MSAITLHARGAGLITILALLALALSLLARRRRPRAALGLDDLVIALSLHMGLVGTLATLLAWGGWFAPLPVALGCFVLALVCWPWRVERERSVPIERPFGLGHTLILLAIVGLGIGLRLPTIPASLAGRDQGTYELRAALTMRTGSLGWTDEVLATAGRELEHAGPQDLLGLYPTSDEPWRAGRYEAAYRPGAYLGDRAAGEVIPQFFHLHPMLLAVAGLSFERSSLAVTWAAGLWLLAFSCCARRLWPRGPWAAMATILVIGSPLAIWTGRTPLSENPMAALEWAAVLVALRLRDESERESGSLWLAGLLALAAGVRGNALVLLPIVLALAWLRPRGRGSGWSAPGSAAAYLLLGGLLASVIVHALTSYPYLHDELLRRLPGAGLGPASLIALTLLGGLAWWVVDREFARAPIAIMAVAELPRLLALATSLAFVLWWSLRSHASEGPPHARLDAAPILLGGPLLGAAALGLVVVARRWRARSRDTWLLALAALIPGTVLLYAPRDLPSLGFFYYGRYLVPELLPAIALAATAGIEAIYAGLAGVRRATWGMLDPSLIRRRVAGALGILLGVGLIAEVVGPLIRHPQLRLREQASAAEAVEWLAARIPADAIVIAGGEGWHHGHTYNQVGGALALAHGIQVVPYRTREDAWLSAWELLVAGPERRGQPPPPVFLLVNEAAHQHTRADRTRVALLDDLLWSPFSIERASMLELFVHALTPVSDQLPTRVARHELRMALLQLRVDPEALAQIHEFDVTRPEVTISGGLFDDGRPCVAPKRPLRIELPRPAEARHLVIVTADADPRSTPSWRLRIDGQAVAIEPPPGLRPHPRASLGPVPIPSRGGDRLVLELTGPARHDDARTIGECPWGGVALVRTLGAERSGLLALAPEDIETATIAPLEDLGEAIIPTAWTSGRALSRYRPGPTIAGKTPAIVGLALELPAGEILEFAPIDLPLDRDGRPQQLELLVTLAGTSTDEGAELRVLARPYGSRADERELGTFAVPSMRRGSWISPPLAWQPAKDRASLRIELVADHGSVELRDLALFVK